MLNKKALAATAAGEAIYIEDVFSTYLYTGTGATQTITNGIDLSGEGGLTLLKARTSSGSQPFYWFDTVRGAENYLRSHGTFAQGSDSTTLNQFNSNGFRIGLSDNVNENTYTFASWTFRKAEKFFDVVTWTGTGSTQSISHSLGSAPGCIIVKRTDTTSNWRVYHRSISLPNESWMHLNTTDASFTSGGTNIWNVTSTTFQADTYLGLSTNGATYVAYLFAHDAGGFGDSGSDNVISCGSFVEPSSGSTSINLGWEPQWVLVKPSSTSGDWYLFDNMRGMPVSPATARLFPNLSDAEVTATSASGPWPLPTATGFDWKSGFFGGNTTFIYVAIRRGPMKTPEAGTEVFKPVTRTGTGSATSITGVGFPPDIIIGQVRNGSGHAFIDKLRGRSKVLESTNTAAEATSSSTQDVTSFDQDGVSVGTVWNSNINASGGSEIDWFFRRAPGFFDVVCYTGTGSNTTVTHNLGVVPELMIVKDRNLGVHWAIYTSATGATKRLNFQSDAAFTTSTVWNDTTPTSSVFSVGTATTVNGSGTNYVAYLFATVSGVSKVGSYTGNGSNQTINCGFTGGARFVLIKRTDSTGDWVVFDSARGIVSGNDPYLELNTTDAEVTDKDAVDTDNTGFVVNETTGPNINTNGASYIFLAIA